MSNKTKKLLILNLPYFIAGLVCTNLGEAWRIAEGADMSEKLRLSFCPGCSLFQSDAKSASDGFADWCVLRGRSPACRVPERKKCQEVSPWHGVRLCPVGNAERHRTV